MATDPNPPTLTETLIVNIQSLPRELMEQIVDWGWQFEHIRNVTRRQKLDKLKHKLLKFLNAANITVDPFDMTPVATQALDKIFTLIKHFRFFVLVSDGQFHHIVISAREEIAQIVLHLTPPIVRMYYTIHQDDDFKERVKKPLQCKYPNYNLEISLICSEMVDPTYASLENTDDYYDIADDTFP